MVRLGNYQKQLLEEMNEFAEKTNIIDRWTPEDISEKFPEKSAKQLIQDHTIDLMYADYITHLRHKKKSSKPKRKKRSGRK